MAEERDNACSIVDYMRDHSGYKCGYCKSKDTNFSHGMWSHRMSVGDYQNLIDRGWRRSGHYCYKPTMDKLCCPMYTIRCDALELKLSKAQKKVLKRMNRYLSHGGTKEEKAVENEIECSGSTGGGQEYVKPIREARDLSSVVISPESLAKAKGVRNQREEENAETIVNKETFGDGECVESCPASMDSEHISLQELNNTENNKMKNKKQVAGPDPSRPPCRKAKDIRRERREAKLAQKAQEAASRGESPMESTKHKKLSVEKTLEDFLNEPLPANPAHTLEVRLVRSQPASPEFLQSAKEAHRVYQKYQTTIHRDTRDKCNEQQYKRFLCNSPLEPWKPISGPDQGYGSFHHQYWLDGRLIAVGVLDVLPHCISSVYLYYDPEFSFLSLGTYASLRELALTRELQRKTPALKWYYMGFYIHSCPKMRYKGRYTPSYLLCPETYVWVPIEMAVPKLDVSKYSRFNDDPAAIDVNGQVDVNKIPILHENTFLPYGTYHQLYPDDDDDEEVREYAAYVGSKTAYNMLLYRS